MVRIRWWHGYGWSVSGLLSVEEALALVGSGYYEKAKVVRDEPGWPPL